MNFIIKITKKYKTNINAKLVNQLDKEDELDLLTFLKKLFILLFDVQEEDINECDEENNNYINENNDISEEVSDNNDLSEEELEQEDFTYFDENKDLSLIKNKLYDLAKTYYKINGKENFYNDKLDKLPNKRKNGSEINNFTKIIQDLLNENYDQKENNKKLKKNNKKNKK